MQTVANSGNKSIVLALGAIVLLFSLALQSCEKSEQVYEESPVTDKKKNNPPPPPPQPFYFTNCNQNPQYTASFPIGSPVNIQFVKNYVNSPGGSYPAFTSATVNGVTITAPAGTFNVGSGSITYTITGTPTNTGYFYMWIGAGNIQQCMAFFIAHNPPVSGPTVDPGPAIGSLGVVNFVYRGQSVAYQTVRAGDGRIWLQQNLGSPQVAFAESDEASFGDYFQWGRWDDGHQLRNSSVVSGGSSLMNPSHIAAGLPSFIAGSTATTRWWNNGTSGDSWNGVGISSTNGKDPCAALGLGWRLPTAAEWQTVSIAEDLFGTIAAWDSRLRLPSIGYRYPDGGIIFGSNSSGHYWTREAAENGNAKGFFFDDLYDAGIISTTRGNGFGCRCIKE